MADWTTISALATSGGTLALAAATFASVRSANRSARATERALLAGIRPVLVPSRLEDPPEKVGFADDHWLKVDGGRAAAEATDDVVYLAIALRNVGNGLAVLDRWDFYPVRPTGDFPHRSPARSAASPVTSTFRPVISASGRARSATGTTPCSRRPPPPSPSGKR